MDKSIYYHGGNLKNELFHNGVLWLADEPSYAKEYAKENNDPVVWKVVINDDLLKVASIGEDIGDDDDVYNPSNKLISYLREQGFNAYYLYYDSFDTNGLALLSAEPIITCNKLSEDEYNEIKELEEKIMRKQEENLMENKNDDKKNKIYHAVEDTPYRNDELKIFLAGTIDGGDSKDWQSKVCKLIEDCKTNSKPIAVYNPRRDDWSDDDQTKLIEEQIKWELEHMEKADIILMNIIGTSKSPITLLEMGIHSKENKLIVFCPDNFYRFDNVKITCKRYGIPLITKKKVEDFVRDKILPE